MSTNFSPKSEQFYIVGAGVFGLMIALELRKRGYEKITVLDRCMPPVPDGLSVDISRLVRIDYADPFYIELGLESVKGWLQEPDYRDCFYKSGFALLSESSGHPYIERARRTLQMFNQEVQPLNSRDEFKKKYPMFDGELLPQISGYWNDNCGCVDAEQAMEALVARCIGAGVSFVTGVRETVATLVSSQKKKKKKTDGPPLSTGETLPCSRVILVTGSWASHLVSLHGAAICTGQPVVSIQLT